jgi:NADPH:quinone reductase-like Zn-dependent oxidoreductase
MLAWTLTRNGEPKNSFELREHPDPSPGADQVLIRCEGFGLNYADVMAVRGLYREAPPLPSILGYEVVGVVEAAGARARKDLIGKRVLALTKFGGYAQKVVTDHRAVVEIDAAVPVGVAAALGTQGVTAWYAARVLCPLHPLERVLVHSAAGGVGQLLVQLAKNAGCEVFAIASGDKKLEFLRSMGADHVFDRKRPDHMQAIKRALDGKRLDASFNAVAGSTFKQDMSMLGSGGRLVLFGGAERGGINTLRFVWRMGVVVPIFLMMKSRSILGINMLKMGQYKPELVAICLREVVKAHHERILNPYVHAEYPHKELPVAHQELASGRTIGKVVVKW